MWHDLDQSKKHYLRSAFTNFGRVFEISLRTNVFTMKYILSCFLVSFVFSIVAQEYPVQWSEMEKGGIPLIEILPISGKNFLTIRQSRKNLEVYKHSNFSITSTGKISTKIKGNVAFYEGVKLVGDQLVVFLSDRREGQDLFFIQKYDDELKPSGDAVQLASYELERGFSRGSFDVITSENKEFFAVIWNVPGKKSIQDKYGFKVFNSNLKEISEGDYRLPFAGDLSEINEHYLSNTGDYFISVTEYSAPSTKKFFKNYMNYKALHLFHITPDLTDQYTVDLKGRRVETMTMNSDNNRLFTISGVFGEEQQSGVAGLFYVRFDFDKNVIINEGFEKFDKNFITQDWSERQKAKADRNEGKGDPQLYNYRMRQSEILTDGSIVGSMEQYYVVANTYYDGRGNAISSHSYYYNDIVAFKIGKEGGFDWLKKINKEQVSTNDGGPFSSYCRFVDGTKIVFIFNDNSENYDANGDFFQPKNDYVYAANYSTKRNVVAVVTLDVFSGEIGRKTFFDRAEVETIAVPKMFNVDYSKNEVLLYGIYRRNERFGIFKLKN